MTALTRTTYLFIIICCFLCRLMYNTIFGGVGAFSREHFELVNGFSNEFWGWGGEDDDLYTRYSVTDLTL